MSNGAMTPEKMDDVVQALEPGDRIRLVFADEPITDWGAFTMAVAIFMPGKGDLEVPEMAFMTLSSIVVSSGGWEGFVTYEATVKPDADLANISKRLVHGGLLESIEVL